MASGHVFSSGISLSESLVRIGFGTTVLMNLGMELVPGWEEIGKAERVRIFCTQLCSGLWSQALPGRGSMIFMGFCEEQNPP